MAPNTAVLVDVFCPDGSIPISGGWSGAFGMVVSTSVRTGTGWHFALFNPLGVSIGGGKGADVTVYCAVVS
jgi:hypothetical protein